MTKEIIINATNEETRIAILEDSNLVELFVERPEYERMVGDIYKAKVSRVLPGMQAAFINIGHEQNAFLHFSDVVESYQGHFADFDQDNGDKSQKKSLPGRFLVLIPSHNHVGISKKISNQKERKRLRNIARQILPPNFGLIIRTVAEGVNDKAIKSDLNTLLRSWQKIEKNIKEHPAPRLVYKDMAMASSIIRDLFSADVDKVVVDSRKLMREIVSYLRYVAPKLAKKVTYYRSQHPIFDEFNIEREIEKMSESKAWLRNGGYVIIEPTEALVSIDVNSGKYIGRQDHESNSLKINLQAAREIARQARLRDLGGLIVIDFIDMNFEENKQKVYNELRKEFNKDRSITKIEEISRFGLVEMTRQRVRPSVLRTINDSCPVCGGTGLVPTLNTSVARIERWIQRYRSSRGDRRITIRVPSDLYSYMNKGRYNRRLKLMWKYWMKIKLFKDNNINIGEYKVYDRLNKTAINLEK
ncbi:MAG: Rne/Rng family ribonuclease [Calditrichaceae bacterium]